MTRSLLALILPGYLLLCLLLGGSSAANWANLALQLLALPLIFWTFAARACRETPGAGRKLLVILGALIVMIALQLIPLPPELWTTLPGRESVAGSYELIGRPLPWLPWSLAPYKTLESAMWLLPPAALLVAIVRLEISRPVLMAWALLSVTIAATLLSTLQIVAGPSWYPYEVTNYGAMTGFFANSNRMVTLLLVSVPFVAALYARATVASHSRRRSLALGLIAAIAPVFLLGGLIMNDSLAGLGIVVPVIGASLMMIWQVKRRLKRGWWLLIAALGVVSTAIVFSPSLGNDLTQVKSATYQATRYYAVRRTLAAALDHAPLGSGVGTFGHIYPRYEDPAQVEMTYMNHAHNEYLEIALETGLPGLLLLALFIGWWVRRTLAVWTVSDAGDVFAQAATIASAAILVHSVVDYPLRTTAISAVFALCCGLMATGGGRTKTATSGTSILDRNS